MAKLARKWIVPAAQRDTANRALQRQGFGPNSFSIALGSNPRGLVTHYAMDIAGLDETELAVLRRFMPPSAVERPEPRLDEALQAVGLVKRLPDRPE